MTDQTPPATDPGAIVAASTAMRAQHFVEESSLLAETVGGTVTLPQLLAAVLASGLDSVPITRDEFTAVYDHVTGLREQFTAAGRIEEAAVTGFGLADEDGEDA